MVMGSMREKKFIQVVLWVVIAAFVGTIFIAWGMKSYATKSGNDDPNTAAVVGHQKVSYDEFYKAMENFNSQLESAGCDPTSPEFKQVRRKVLDGLVDDAILRETAAKLGLSVSNEELAANIMREQAFLDSNRRFSKERYLQVLESNNLTSDQFESGLRQNILNQRIRGVLNESVLYTPAELQRFGTLLHRDLKARYVALDPAVFEKSVTLSHDNLERYFEDNQDRYNKPERAKLRHILLQAGPEAGATELAGLAKQAADLRQQILSKKITFAEAAKKFSKDPGTKDKGGELGWVTRGMMVAPFENAAFKLAKGELSQAVTTQFGVHLIQLEDYDKGKKATLESIRPQLEKDYRKSEGTKKLQGLLLRLALRLQDGKSLTDAAKELNLPVKETAWFNRAGGLKEWKGSKDAAETLAEKQLGDWDGPLQVGKMEAVFEISAEKSSPVKTEDLMKEMGDLQARYVELLKRRWMEDFFTKEKAELKVKIRLKDDDTKS